jgi:hypothetical protein
MEDLKRHSFFGPQFPWEELREKQVFYDCTYDINQQRCTEHQQKPPFVPELQSAEDTSYFDDFTAQENDGTYEQLFEKRSKDEQESKESNVEVGRNDFLGFTFTHKQIRAWKAFSDKK